MLDIILRTAVEYSSIYRLQRAEEPLLNHLQIAIRVKSLLKLARLICQTPASALMSQHTMENDVVADTLTNA